MNLLSVLAEKKIINKEEISAIEAEARSSGELLESVLARKGIDPDIILETKGEFLNIPTRRLKDEKVPTEVLNYIPEESALHYKFVPLGVRDGVLEVGVVDPDNIEALDALNFISSKINLPFKIYLVSPKDFELIIQMYQGLSGEVNKALTELESELSSEKGGIGELERALAESAGTDSKVIREDAPVTKIVANMLRYAVEGGASDIHIEHTGDTVRVRYRVDGVLNTSLVLPVKVHSAVVARVKILTSMRLDEKRKPQDGRFSATIGGRRIDFRVSTFPAYYGEKVAIRVLDPEKGVRKLDEVGLSARNLELVRNAIKRPYGIILMSGPTGSGKTTTLYSMLNEIDRETQNVLSLEDPVEYNVKGMSQSQVHPEIGYTFANGLRTTLRQDPDIIMVGEIRDKETAQLAIQAALTGHLVLSTIHTNNAIGVIPRLIDMGVDPYLIAPTLVLAMAQRLVKTLCTGAGKKLPLEGSLKMMIEKQFEDIPEKFRKEIPKTGYVVEAESSPTCPNGTRGRMAVFEMLAMDTELESVILKNPVESELMRVARKQGMLTMKEDAIMKSMQGLIPFREVNTLGGALLSEEEN